MTQLPDPTDPSLDPQQAQRQQEGSDPLGATADALEVGGLLIDATNLAVQAGSLAIEAGATTIKVAATGAEIVGSVVGGLFEAL